MSVSRHAKKGLWKTGILSCVMPRKSVERHKAGLRGLLCRYGGKILNTSTQRTEDGLAIIDFHIGYHCIGNSDIYRELRPQGVFSDYNGSRMKRSY